MSQDWTKIAVVIGLTLGLVYIVKLSDLVLENHWAGQSAARVEAEVGLLRDQVEALETAAVDAESDAYVERWAREDRKMVRPGDQAVAIVPAEASAEVAPETMRSEPTAWQRFVNWLRGDDTDHLDETEDAQRAAPALAGEER